MAQAKRRDPLRHLRPGGTGAASNDTKRQLGLTPQFDSLSAHKANTDRASPG